MESHYQSNEQEVQQVPLNQQQFMTSAQPLQYHQPQFIQWTNPPPVSYYQDIYGGYQAAQQYFPYPQMHYPYIAQNIPWGYQFAAPQPISHINPYAQCVYTPSYTCYPNLPNSYPQYVYPIEQILEGRNLQYPQEQSHHHDLQHPQEILSSNSLTDMDMEESDEEGGPTPSVDVPPVEEIPPSTSTAAIELVQQPTIPQTLKDTEPSSSVSSTVLKKVGDKVFENIYVVNTAFKNRIITYRCEDKSDVLFLNDFFHDKKENVLKLLQESLQKHKVIKFNLELRAEYVKKINDEDNEAEIGQISHRSPMMLATREHDFEDLVNEQLDLINTKMASFQERDSGWALLRILALDINVNQAALLKGSSYIKTPYKLALKKACLNIRNNDNYCFKWCLVAAVQKLYFENCASYNITSIESDVITLTNGVTLNFKNLSFPLSIKNIKTFEKNNPNISINVFGWDNDNDAVIGPFKLTDEEKDMHINLLLLEEGDLMLYNIQFKK